MQRFDQEPQIGSQRFLAAFDFRAHGATQLGDPEKLRLDVFADDLVAFMDHLQIETAVLGGISMGAAVALQAALRHPERCVALVLCRPAWLNGYMSAPAIAAYAEVVRLLREPSPESALQRLEKSDIYRVIATQSADAGKSLLGQIRCVVADPNLREAAVARLQYLPMGQPGLDLESADGSTRTNSDHGNSERPDPSVLFRPWSGWCDSRRVDPEACT